MSIAEFTSALKDQAYKQWFKTSSKNILANTVKEYRKEAESTSRTSFLLTTDTLLQIAEKLTGRDITSDEAEKIFSTLVGMVDNKKAILIQEDILDGKKTITGVYFRQIEFEKGISSVISKSIDSIKDRVVIEEKDGKTRPAIVSDFFQKGHVFGVATNVTTQTARNLAKSKVTEASKKQLLGTLVAVRNKLLRQDLATANIKDIKFSLYSKYLKTPYKYLVEMQIKEENVEAGGEARLYTNALRRYFSPENNAGSIAKDLRTKDSAGDKFIGRLINARGSPSMVDLIALEIASKIDRQKRKTSYSIPSSKVATISQKVDTKALKDKTKKALVEINKAISLVRTIVPGTTSTTAPTANLEALLRDRLALQIRKNMGTGSATNVLNYQTGRFADSATIERTTTSREGMISVFYNYMKNPYAPFSEGGAQQSPKTRDPKLLISKSIREIGASLVGNRMRAVLV